MSRWKEFRREPVAGEWSRKQKRGYHRVRSLLWFWESHQFQVLWVTLSTAEGGDAEKLTYHHKQLRQRIERQLGFAGLEYYQVRTDEGHGVLHIFWAWRVPDGERARRFWISQEWLSSQWEALHGAPVVWIKAYQPSHRSRNRLSRYVISQYVQDQCWLREYVLVVETVAWGSPSGRCGKRCGTNGRPRMSTDAYGNRSKFLASSFSRPGRICCLGTPSGSVTPFSNSSWAKASSGVRYEEPPIPVSSKLTVCWASRVAASLPRSMTGPERTGFARNIIGSVCASSVSVSGPGGAYRCALISMPRPVRCGSVRHVREYGTVGPEITAACSHQSHPVTRPLS